MFNIDEIPVADDLNVAVDPETYQDVQPPMPFTRGAYGVRIDPESCSLVKYGEQHEKAGELVLQDGLYPLLQIGMIEVVEGVEAPRKLPLYQTIRIKPRTRKGFGGEADQLVSDLGELIRSGDATAKFSGWKEGLAILQSLIAQGTVFYFKLDWEAVDQKAIREEVEELKTASEDPRDAETRKAINQVYKTYTRRGQTKFKAPNGDGYVPFMEGKDGSRINARTVVPMDGFISQAQLSKVALGPSLKA